MKPAFYEEDAEKKFTNYVIERSIKRAQGEIDDINEQLRMAAKKGTDWDEFHCLMVRQVFELRRVIDALYNARDCLHGYLIDYLKEQEIKSEEALNLGS